MSITQVSVSTENFLSNKRNDFLILNRACEQARPIFGEVLSKS